MIVVDAQVLVYATLPSADSDLVTRLAERDPGWHAPVLWQSEFLNACAAYLRSGRASGADCLSAFASAEWLIGGRQHGPVVLDVLAVVETTRLSAYDAEYVALARQLGLQLVTFDRQVLSEAPGIAIHPEAFLAA